MLERLKKLNIFGRIKELETKEAERDQSLEIMLIHLEAMQTYIEKRISTTEEQNTKLNAIVGRNLDLKPDLDVI